MIKLNQDILLDKQVKDLVYVVPKARIVWSRIPKCASNSIINNLYKEFSSRGWTKGNCDILMYGTHLVKEIPNYHGYNKFAFVRNPWSRLVSCYHSRVKEFYDATFGVGSYEPKAFEAMGFRKDITFKEFVDIVCNQDDENSDHHWRSQYCSTHLNGTLLMTFIGRVETINRDWKNLCNVLDWSYIEPPMKKISEHTHYTDYYDSVTRNAVAKRFEQDIDLFKYTYAEN